MLTSIVKVVLGGKTIYLEKARYIDKGKIVFLSGYQIRKDGEPVMAKGNAEILHLIEMGRKDANGLFKAGEGAPRVYAVDYNPTYCELEYASTATGRWSPGVSAKKARIH